MRRLSAVFLRSVRLPILLGLCLAAPSLRAAAPAPGPAPDATLATASAVSAADLRIAYDRAAREALTTPAPATHQALAELALDLADAGVTEIDGDPILVRASSHALDALLSTEAASAKVRPAAYLGPAWTLLDRLLGAGATVEQPAVALAVEGTARRIARRFDLAPTGVDVEGWAGAAWHDEAARLRALFAVDPGNLALVSRLWRAETVLADCAATFAAGQGGLEEATLQLRAAKPRTAAGRRRVSRGWASTHACALEHGRADYRAITADRLLQAALDQATPREIAADPEMAWWIGLGLTTAMDAREANKDASGMLALVARGLSPALQPSGWRERSVWAFNAALRARNVATADPEVPLDELRTSVEEADALTDQAFDQLYRADLARVDEPTRVQVLASLETYALVCERYRDMPDRAGRAGELADRIRSLPATAAPTAPVSAAPADVAWPDPLDQIVADARLLAELAADAHVPGDAGGARFAHRYWVLRDLEGVTVRLARRAGMPGVVGDDARDRHVGALTWLALAHAAAGDPTGADLLFEQIAALDPAWLDLPLGGGAESPRLVRSRWAGATPAEVRMVLLAIPTGGPKLAVVGSTHHADVEALATRDLAGRYRAWFVADGGTRWVAAWVPREEGVRLAVGTTPLALPPGEGAVVGRLEPSADRWSIAPLPVPVPGRPL